MHPESQAPGPPLPTSSSVTLVYFPGSLTCAHTTQKVRLRRGVKARTLKVSTLGTRNCPVSALTQVIPRALVDWRRRYLWRGPHNEREYTRDKIPQADFGNPGYQKLNKENKSRLQSIFHLLQDMFDCFQAVTDHVFLI